MFSRVSCARAASESTAYDVFIFPKQWKYKMISRTSQMLKASHQSLNATSERMAGAVPGRRTPMGLGSALPWPDSNVWRRLLGNATRLYGRLGLGSKFGNHHRRVHDCQHSAVRSEAAQTRRIVG